MKNTIYISKNLDLIDKNIVIEGDIHSVWAYIVDSKSYEIILDGFICSRGTVLDSNDEIKEYVEKGFAPPLSKDYKNEYSVLIDLKNEDIHINQSGKIVNIKILDEIYLTFDIMNSKSFSKSISKPGPFGFPMI